MSRVMSKLPRVIMGCLEDIVGTSRETRETARSVPICFGSCRATLSILESPGLPIGSCETSEVSKSGAY